MIKILMINFCTKLGTFLPNFKPNGAKITLPITKNNASSRGIYPCTSLITKAPMEEIKAIIMLLVTTVFIDSLNKTKNIGIIIKAPPAPTIPEIIPRIICKINKDLFKKTLFFLINCITIVITLQV